ncbi:MAG: DsbA family protein [bacterium]
MRLIRRLLAFRFLFLFSFLTLILWGCCHCDGAKTKTAHKSPPPTLEEQIKHPVAVSTDGSPTQGPDNAPITIIEFSDFQCPFCKRAVPTMKQLMKDYDGKIRWVFRQHPLAFHTNARSAAKASLAAHEQGKFWEMHDALMENQQDLSEESIRKIAKQIGLKMAPFEKAWKSDQFEAQIKKDTQFAEENGATGTPSFFINGVLVKGARPMEDFKGVIDRLLKGK